MIALTERWSVFRDSRQWVLCEVYEKQPTKKNPLGGMGVKESYHPWLASALRFAAEKDCQGAKVFGDVEKAYNSLLDAFTASINRPDRSALELHAKCKDLENQNAELRRQLRG